MERSVLVASGNALLALAAAFVVPALAGTVVVSGRVEPPHTLRASISVSCRVMPRPAPVIRSQTIGGVTYVTWTY